MLERKARSIGQESQESFPFLSKYAPSKVHDTLGGDYSVAQVYGEDSYIPTHYVCTDCGKKYKWLDSLKRHQRVDCGNKEKKFSCHACDRKFKYRYELRNHITANHAGDIFPSFRTWSSSRGKSLWIKRTWPDFVTSKCLWSKLDLSVL